LHCRGFGMLRMQNYTGQRIIDLEGLVRPIPYQHKRKGDLWPEEKMGPLHKKCMFCDAKGVCTCPYCNGRKRFYGQNFQQTLDIAKKVKPKLWKKARCEEALTHPEFMRVPTMPLLPPDYEVDDPNWKPQDEVAGEILEGKKKGRRGAWPPWVSK